MATVDMPRDRCVACGYVSDAASSVKHDAAPKAGDLTICLACGKVYAFEADLSRRPLSSKEIAALPEREFLERAQAAQRKTMRGHRVVAGRIVEV